MNVRAAQAADYDGITALYSQLHSSEKMGERPADLEQWQALINHPGSTVFVAEADGQLVGTVVLHVLPNMTREGRPYALIENVVTHQGHRGKGIGRAVMQRAIEEAWAANAYKIMLLTGKQREDGVKKFYQKLGFDADTKHGMYLAHP